MERTKMKLPVAVFAISSAAFLLAPSPGVAQQAGASTNTSSRQTQPFQPFFSPPSPTIRVIGSPTVQPSPGTRQECTPVEQDIVGSSSARPTFATGRRRNGGRPARHGVFLTRIRRESAE